MRSNFKPFQLFCVFLFAVTASATLLFRPSGANHAEKRALLNTYGLTATTNAKRMAAGLPLLPPRTRTDTAKRSGVSVLPISRYIQVRDTSGAVKGYVSKSTGVFGRYFLNTGSLVNSGTFSSSVAQVGKTTQLNFIDTLRSVPLAGGIFPGFDLSDSSATSAVLGPALGSPATPPGSTAQISGNPNLGHTYETAIWTYDASSGAIAAQWVNSDGSMPSTTILYDPGHVGFYLTASPQLLMQNPAYASAYPVTFFLASV